jgi:ankyrin repeat protein
MQCGKPEPQRLACLEWLLAHGADPELTGAWPPARALIVAAFAGEPAYVKVLRAAGARVDGFTGAALGDAKLVSKTLAAHPEFARERDSGALTALQCATGSRLPKVDFLRVAALLLDAGADPNAQTRTFGSTVDAAYFACGAKNAAMFELLLERGADATVAIGHAVWRKKFELADRALGHGADLDRATANGKPLLNDLIRWGQIPQTMWMLEHGASPNVADTDGWTAAHQAASRGNARLLKAVIDAGADLRRRDKSDRTPLDVACGRQARKVGGDAGSMLKRANLSSNTRHLAAFGQLRWGGHQPAADFSPPAAGFCIACERRAEARRRLKLAPRVSNQQVPSLLIQSEQYGD